MFSLTEYKKKIQPGMSLPIPTFSSYGFYREI